MGKGQLGPFGSDRPTSCSTRMDPTVNGNNDECFFPVEGRKKMRHATICNWSYFFFTSLQASSREWKINEIRTKNPCGFADPWTKIVLVISEHGNNISIWKRVSNLLLFLTKICYRSFLFSRNYHIRDSHRENKQFFSSNFLLFSNNY